MEECIKNIVMTNINVEGDIIELGVYKGRNTFIIGNLLKSMNCKKKYIGYDTFEGYTQNDIDNALTEKQKKALLSGNKRKIWKVDEKKILEKIHTENLEDYCQIIKGDICDTISNCKSEKIQIIYVDCNAYLPAITALKSLKSKLQDSSFIVIDEHTIGGETASLREFMKETKGKLYKLNTTYLTGPRIIYHVKIGEKESETYLEIEKKLKSRYKIVNKLEKE